MPVLDGDGNARPESTNNGSSVNNSNNGSLAINTSKQKSGYGTITPQYIVIHNTAGGTASSNADWFVGGAGGSGNCTQFITDDKEIYQIMPPTQKARHIQGSNTGGGKGCASWASSNAPALAQCGATNSNSIGIEVADAYSPSSNTYDDSKVDMAKAVELTIELTRYLMTQYNIPAENVVRHGDTHNKPCPNRIMELGLWPYFKEQIVKRNQENRPVSFNPATLNTTGQPVSIGNGATATLMSTGSGGTTLLDTPLYASPTDIEVQLPDVDHRENNTNMDEVKGLSLIFYPPYNSCEATDASSHFALFNYNRDYHFIIGKGSPLSDEEGSVEGDGTDNASIQPRTPEEGEDTETPEDGEVTAPGEVVVPEGDPVGGSKELETAVGFSITASTPETMQSKGFTDNDIHTYIDRALFQNKRQKHNLTVALMCPKDVEDYPAYEKALIEGVSIILHEHGLSVSDLWREFDLNRAPSPFLYLNTGTNGDMPRWQDFLIEVEKQLNWRIAKFGKYEKTYVPYTAGSSGLSGGSTGSISGGTLGGGGTIGTTPSNGAPITGDTQMKSENEVVNVLYATFIKLGCTPEAACGIIGNIEQESSLRPTIVNYKGATGLCQWLDTRLTGLKNYASSKGTQWTDVATQAEWVIEELKGKDPTTKSFLSSKEGLTPEQFMQLTDLSRAVTAFRRCFERCGEGEARDDKRLSFAKKWYDQVAQVTDSGTVLPPGITDDDLEVASLDLEPMMFATPRSNNVVFVGDSLTVGIGQNVSGTKTYATSGFTVSQGSNKYLSQLLSDKPLIIVMSFGTNDAAGGNASTFVSNYKKFITKLKEGIPNVQIFINKILPGNSSKPNCTSGYKTAIRNIPSFNAKLSEIAQAGATVIDCTGVINTSTHYSNDGLHLTGEGYKLWHQEIIKQVNASGSEGGTPETKTSSVFGWPLPGISKVSSKFGPRTPPCPGASSMHGGIDIGAPSGTPIMCYAAGTVKENVSGSKSAGNYITIDHGSGVITRYLHMCEKSPLAVGTPVTAGQQIGKVGNTGVGTGPHLHFEIHINGEKVDPLEYVTPGGGSTGKMTNLGDASGGGIPGTQLGTGTGGSIGAPSEGLLYDDKQQNKTDAPIGENSAGSQTHDDWGGKMVYKKGEPSDEGAVQPEIQTIITQEMYKDIIEYSDFSLVDDYVQDFEPYSKGLASVEDSQISINDRAAAMTKKFTTTNENTFHYKVIESGPGSKDHCVTIAEELNYLAIPEDLKVEPIYPDLVIPPGYISTDADASSPNSIPIATIEESGITSSEAFTKQMSFDYDVLEDKKKVSNKTHHPINYTDPYPYDEKITDLERHYPKIFIDEIEGQLYSCNHPGCPISQPMAKNFAMLSDALLNQSKRIEKRLSRVENVLSTIIRNQGRLGARMNINCVYYGGHSTFNKYKCIRCLHDDRIHDGELVTIDQCLNCTRFEPILGQVYRILDDSGLNGSIILDDMQMSYTDLEGFRNLNDLTHRSSRYYNAMATEETNCKKPEKTLVELWKAADKDQAIKAIRDESTDEAEAQKRINELKEEDYIFKMDWAETFFNSQEPDTKLFPNEGIVARQKADVEGDGAHTLEDTLAELDPKLDAEAIEEIKERIRIRDNVWVDTRNTADSIQVNKYSSENFFFEDFNKVRIGKYGVKFSSLYNYNGEDYSTVYSATMAGGGSGISLLNNSNSSSAFASQVRDKIVEMAKKIYQDCVDGKAWYSQDYRTCEYDKPVTIKAGNGSGKTGYDCTSFVSCCYMYAGLKSMYAKSCSGGTLVREIQKGGKMIPCTKENMTYILPGDILLTASGTVTQNQCNQLQFITTSHAAIYVGNNQIIHARGKDKGIQTSSMDYYLSKSNYVFVRPADLMESDKIAAQQSSITGGSGGVTEESGTINGQSYVAKIPQAVVTAYTGGGQGANGPITYNAHCASHNMPYGTKIYIPELAGKAGTGIYTVQDTGGCFFDFDIYTTTWSGKTNMDAYVLEWGTSSKIAESYTWAMDLYNKRGTWDKLKAAWVAYKNMNGKLVNFHKYRNEDANIKNHPNYNS